ncbi:MAG: hypothetical protein OXF44_06805 [Anaerolineaceae bacterium]|nr:hypothetical protein [Anaerolineaceae bacterium]MCY4023799.1 hypothetical protein [Anaerolineaceae bacterium]
MTSSIDKETFQRLTLFYLVGCFERGVFSSFRLQKVLYYATRDVEPRPFTFHHTKWGQYSRDASIQLLHMLEGSIVQRESLSGGYGGALWKVGSLSNVDEILGAFEEGIPEHADAIRKSVEQVGNLKQGVLDELVHSDPILKERRRGRILIKENGEKRIRISLDEDTVEDLEFALNPMLSLAMARLARTVSETDFDISKVRTIDTLDALL